MLVTIVTRDRFHQHVYDQLLRLHIPKVQKDSQVVSVFCAFEIVTWL